MSDVYEIRLIITRKPDGLFAKWVDAGSQLGDEIALTLPLTKDDTDALRWYLEESLLLIGPGDRVKAQAIEARMKDWGRALFDSVFNTGPGTNIYRNLMDAERDGRPGLITLGSLDPVVLSQPWEMLRDVKGPLALRSVTFRRQLLGAKAAARFDYRPPLRILLIVSRPTDVGFIDPRNSIPPVLDACDALGGLAQVEFCDPPTLSRLEEMISLARKQRRPYHIVHFDGHGTYLPLTGVGALAFEDEHAKVHRVKGADFGDLLSRLDVPLALLEACRGADLSDRPVFGSLAPALLEAGVGSVVAFSHSVHIQAARLLVERFYRELVSGSSVGAALQEARAALRANPKRYLHLGPNAESIELQDWFIPQLYQVGSDPILIPSGSLLDAEAPASGLHRVQLAAALKEFPPEPLYKFHGRALELLEIERAFRKHTGVVVSGMGGMGKTALSREAAAWWLRTGRFDTAMFISFEQKISAEQAVKLIGRALEGEDFSRRSGERGDEKGQWETAVELFHQRRVLVVWDNFESTLPIYQQDNTRTEPDGGPALETYTVEDRQDLQVLYRDLTAGKPLGRLLVTCRPEETGLPGIKQYALEGLKRYDSLHLLAAAADVKGIDLERKGYERAEIMGLIDLLADHPLSIELIAPHLKTLTPAEIRLDFGALLAQFQNLEAKEARNRGLLASLEFSRRRLSPEAQAALPWLAWFEGGVFELFLTDFMQIEPLRWEAVRAELEATALVQVETLEGFNTPYLRFHPTLSYAARPKQVGDPQAAEQRFIQVYLAVMQTADHALHGQHPAGMTLGQREEANLRRAMQRALAGGLRQEGQRLADSLQYYYERAGRNRERDRLVEWVRSCLPDNVLDVAVCAAIRDHAWTLVTQGQAQTAVQRVQALLERLQAEGLAGGEAPAFQVAVTYSYLGRIFDHAGRSDLAVEPLNEAIAHFERLPGETARGNLATALGDLAIAYRRLGRLDEALANAERSLTINRELGYGREVAGVLDQSAEIFTDAHRYPEAEQRYAEALHAARTAGDLGLQSTILQHQGILHSEQGLYENAMELYQQAIAIFQRANAPAGEMQTCDLLATVEMNLGKLNAAEAWYGRARQLAGQLNDRRQLAAEAQNLGILFQRRAEAESDPAQRRRWLEQAAASVAESLKITLENNNQPGAADSYYQLGLINKMLGDLDAGERFLRQSIEINESLGMPEVYKDYAQLADVARLRGDEAAAAEWQAKAEAHYAEIQRRERGEGSEQPRIDDKLYKFILGLAQVCYQVRAAHAALPPDDAEALAQMQAAPSPFPGIAGFLQAAAAGQRLPSVPPGLPAQIAEILRELKEAIRE